MALTDENMVMPVTPMGSYNNGGLFGGNCGDSWLGILFLIALCNGGFGFGGFGGGYGAMAMGMGMDGFGLYPWLNNSQNINDGFRSQAIETQVGNIGNAITAGFGDVQTALCGGFAGVNQNVSQGFASTNLGLCQGFNGVNNSIFGAQTAISSQLSNNELANLERSFAAQTANTAGLTNLSAQLANCCCENRSATQDLKYTIATENCADRAAIADGLKDVLAATQAQTQAILDKMCQQELDAERRENNNLRSELMYARGQASQVAQTQAIEASQAAQTQYLVNRIAPYPQPAIVYGYNTNWVNPLPTTTSGTTTA